MARWTVSPMTDLPTVSDGDPHDPTWYPIQHALGIDTFGINLFAATRSEQTLVEEHDESKSGQQELYLVLAGEAVFELDGEEVRAEAGTAVAVTDPSVRRSAKARAPGTMLLIVGAGRSGFSSTWSQNHFHDIPRSE
jgi:hypothetical protein